MLAPISIFISLLYFYLFMHYYFITHVDKLGGTNHCLPRQKDAMDIGHYRHMGLIRGEEAIVYPVVKRHHYFYFCVHNK